MPITNEASNNLKTHYDHLNDMVLNVAQKPNEDINVARWNTFYYKKYKAQNNILLFINGVCVFVIILKLLRRGYPYFDQTSYLTILGITIGLTASVLFFALKDIYYKDNMNFDEYEFTALTPGTDISMNKQNTDYSGYTSKDICMKTNPFSFANSRFIKNFV
jgi:hypothetical protein